VNSESKEFIIDNNLMTINDDVSLPKSVTKSHIKDGLSENKSKSLTSTYYRGKKSSNKSEILSVSIKSLSN